MGPPAKPARPISDFYCTSVDLLPINGSNPGIRPPPRPQARSPTMTKMITCLWFDKGKAREAAAFYASVFPDSHIGKAHASAADNPSGKEGDELIVEFTVLGQAYV